VFVLMSASFERLSFDPFYFLFILVTIKFP